MADFKNMAGKAFGEIKDFANKNIEKIDVDAIKKFANETGAAIAEKAGDVKDAALDIKDDITEKLTELDRMLSESVTQYNDAYTLMNDKGVQLFIERSRSIDSISFVEGIINSIANTPKSFATDIETISIAKNEFKNSCDFAQKELQAARNAAGGAGAGLAAGASVAFMAPSAAMWIATTFGTASTGTAISALSGAAASNAALAWLGGGAIAAGGNGIVAGQALLALAGPIGWSIAGATLLTSIILFASKKNKLNKQKNQEIEAVKDNIERVKEADAEISELLSRAQAARDLVNNTYSQCVPLFGANYNDLSEDKKQCLGKLVTATKAMALMLKETIIQVAPDAVEG